MKGKMTTPTITLTTHLRPEFTEDSDFLTYVHDPNFIDNVLSSAWALYKYMKEKNGSISVSALVGDARLNKFIESYRHKFEVEKVVIVEKVKAERDLWEDRAKNLEAQLAFERDRCETMLQSKVLKQSSARVRGEEGEELVCDVLSMAFKSNKDYMITNNTKSHNEADIHVVNTKKKTRIAIEVKNKAYAIKTDDVTKVPKDIAFIKNKYKDDLIGFIFVSLCGKQRIPTKGFSHMEWVHGVPVIWSSIDIEEDGYNALRSILMDRVEMLEGLSTQQQPVGSVVSSDEESEEVETICQLEEELGILRILSAGDKSALDNAYKVFETMERQGKAGKMGIAAHLRNRCKDVVAVVGKH